MKKQKLTKRPSKIRQIKPKRVRLKNKSRSKKKPLLMPRMQLIKLNIRNKLL